MWNAVVCRVMDPAIRVVSVDAARSDGGGRGGGGKVGREWACGGKRLLLGMGNV